MPTIVLKDTLTPSLKRFAKQYRWAVRKALDEEARAILAEALVLCPVGLPPRDPHPGLLRSSGTTQPAEWFGNTCQAVITFGGYGTGTYSGVPIEYAVDQHENTTYKHRSPQQAKFLERPILGARDTFVARIEARIAEIMEAWA